MDVVRVKSKDSVTTIRDFIASQNHGIAYCVHDMKSVFITEVDSINEDSCEEFGYTVLDTRHTGGAVVVSEGDISVVHFGRTGDDFIHRFAQYLVERYNEKGLDASFDGNDILVNGYKTSGLSATPYDHIQYSTIHIGIHTNVDHVKAICKKPMVKIPKGLSEYGITTDEIEEMLLAFCEQI